MKSTAKLWLPLAAKGASEAAIEKAVQQWEGDWLGFGARLHVAQTPASTLRKLVWRGSLGVLVGAERGMLARLGLALCAGAGELENPLDVALLENLGAQACASLAELLGDGNADASMQGDESLPAWTEPCFRLSDAEGMWAVALAMSAEALIAIRRRGATGDHLPKLGTFAAALSDELCAVGVHLGRAKLTSAELATLGSGDVLLLDRSTNESIPLVVSESYPEKGSAKIEAQGQALRVVIATPISLIASEAVPA